MNKLKNVLLYKKRGNIMKKKSKIFKIIVAILAIAILIGIVVYLIPLIRELSTTEGQLAFKKKIDKAGVWGVLMLFGIQLAQIFLIIIPGEPIEIFAGMCYGTLGGTLFVMISAAIITTLIVIMVKKLGRKFVYEFCPKERMEKIENSKMFKKPKRLEWIIIILFILPGTPKDLLVYLGALLPIDSCRFIVISTLARFPSVISSTLAGSNLLAGNWKLSIAIYLITFALIGIAIWIINKFDKSKATEDIIESIK